MYLETKASEIQFVKRRKVTEYVYKKAFEYHDKMIKVSDLITNDLLAFDGLLF